MAASIDPGILRAYDIRGVAGETLTEDAVGALGGAFAVMLRRRCPAGERPRVAVGYDGRLSSPALEAALVAGLAGAGADVLRIGLGPTPMLYFAVHRLELDGGLMVTGSHNPPEYNGLKMALPDATFGTESIVEMGRIAAGPAPHERLRPASGGAVGERAVKGEYVARLLAEAAMQRPLDVVWDAGNGATGAILGALVAGLPGRHTVLYDDIDGRFPNHHPDPTVPENLRDLTAAVRREGAALGIAFDGDGDRIGVVDGEGEMLWGDQLMTVWAADILASRPGATIIADVKASQVLFDTIARLGGVPLMCRTGHTFIKAKLKEVGAPLAGEMSGHFCFADRYWGYDDAPYAAVRLLNALAGREDTLADIRRALPPIANTGELRFACDDRRKFEVVNEVRQRLAARGGDVVTVDGMRVSHAGGWWLLRASNTEPRLVARCEAPDEAALARVRNDLEAMLSGTGVSPPEP